MLKILFFILIISPFNLFGQISIGLNFGMNYGNYDTRYSGSFAPYYNMFSYKGGVDFRYKFGKNYFLRSGLLYSQRGGSVDNPFIERRDKLIAEFLELPIIINRIYKERYSIGLGLVISHLGNPVVHRIEERSYDLDFSVGIGFNFYTRFNIEASYLFGGLLFYFNKNGAYLYSVGNLSLSYRIFQFK